MIETDGDTATTRTLLPRGGTRTRRDFLSESLASLSTGSGGQATIGVFASRSFQYLWLDTSPLQRDGLPALPRQRLGLD